VIFNSFVFNHEDIILKMPMECICCGSRVDSKDGRPFHGIVMRLYVAVRTDLFLPDSGIISVCCRMSYLKWRGKREFAELLDEIDRKSNETINDGDKRVTALAIGLNIILPSFV
jgi:hypothetical protein